MCVSLLADLRWNLRTWSLLMLCWIGAVSRSGRRKLGTPITPRFEGSSRGRHAAEARILRSFFLGCAGHGRHRDQFPLMFSKPRSLLLQTVIVSFYPSQPRSAFAQAKSHEFIVTISSMTSQVTRYSCEEKTSICGLFCFLIGSRPTSPKPALAPERGGLSPRSAADTFPVRTSPSSGHTLSPHRGLFTHSATVSRPPPTEATVTSSPSNDSSATPRSRQPSATQNPHTTLYGEQSTPPTFTCSLKGTRTMKKTLSSEQVRCLLLTLEEELSSVEHQIASPTTDPESVLYVHEMQALNEKAVELRNLVVFFADPPDM